MNGYVVLALAALFGIAIRIDAQRRDPYFALSDLVPGTAITKAFGEGDARTRRAVISRFAYPVVYGVILGAFVTSSPADALAGGFILAGLMLWPIVFHGLPRGVLRTDWLLIPLYVSVIAIYAGATLLGQQFVLVVAKGDLLGYARDKVVEFIVAGALVAIGAGLLPLTTRPSRKRGRRRS